MFVNCSLTLALFRFVLCSSWITCVSIVCSQFVTIFQMLVALGQKHTGSWCFWIKDQRALCLCRRVASVAQVLCACAVCMRSGRPQIGRRDRWRMFNNRVKKNNPTQIDRTIRGDCRHKTIVMKWSFVVVGDLWRLGSLFSVSVLSVSRVSRRTHVMVSLPKPIAHVSKTCCGHFQL